MNSELLLHFIHISGKRMIAQGTDGLSRGNTMQGVLQGAAFSGFVPLHLSALERQTSPLTNWVNSWFGSVGEFTWLKPEDWYYQVQFEKRCIWCPPPAAAEAALEQLVKSIHKQPYQTHLVLIPRLMTAFWRKLL
jgi:hypothetical protein